MCRYIPNPNWRTRRPGSVEATTWPQLLRRDGSTCIHATAAAGNTDAPMWAALTLARTRPGLHVVRDHACEALHGREKRCPSTKRHAAPVALPQRAPNRMYRCAVNSHYRYKSSFKSATQCTHDDATALQFLLLQLILCQATSEGQSSKLTFHLMGISLCDQSTLTSEGAWSNKSGSGGNGSAGSPPSSSTSSPASSAANICASMVSALRSCQERRPHKSGRIFRQRAKSVARAIGVWRWWKLTFCFSTATCIFSSCSITSLRTASFNDFS